jgi:serine/threonine-protein kinase RsbW
VLAGALGERNDDGTALAARKVLIVNEVIDLTLPVKPELMVLVRFAAATLAAQAEFSVEEIDDLRLAADEICLSVTGGTGTGPMRLQLSREDDLIEISCTVDVDVLPSPDGDDPEGQWSLRILDALVDEHGREVSPRQCRAWLRKRRARSTV